MSPSRIACVLLLFALFSPQTACSKAKEGTAQLPAVAGAFYPGGTAELKELVGKLLAEAPKRQFDGEIIGLVAPHAGYEYSGPIAAAAFKQVEGKRYARVVVLGLSHRVPVAGAALSTRDLYRTPLGDIPIDTGAVQKLIAEHPWAKDDQAPYAQEHSLEVELPFLQMALGDFKLVPIIVGTHDPAMLDVIARGLIDAFPGDDTLFVASSDLSHYLPYKEAEAADRATLALVTDRDAKAYYEGVMKDEAKLCGSAPVSILKRIAEKRNAKLVLVEHANSGDTAGDKSRVVGYAAIAAIAPPAGVPEKQREELLKLARATVVARVTGKKLPSLPGDPALQKDGAAFVTLRKGGALRGCIGQILATGPLGRSVQAMAVAAATEDPRFKPVGPEELKQIDIEISVLTPPEPLPDPQAVRVGTDGLILEKGRHRGVLLPQVPVEQGWTKAQYLDGICQKSGLPPGCAKDATLRRFQAVVFGEKP